MTKRSVRIPACVQGYMRGAEVYAENNVYEKCSPGIRARAVEDAQYLIDIGADGIERPQQVVAACRRFLAEVRALTTASPSPV